MAEKILAITGGASGIGLAIAEAALAEGWRVAVADRDEAALERSRAALDPARATFAALDVTDEAAVEGWVAGAAAQGRLAGAVAAAGIAADVPALDTPTDLFRRILDVNVTGSFLLARAAGRTMRDAGEGGAILLVASVSGLRGAKGRAAYGASKAAVINLAQVMALEGAAHGVRVNALCPGPVETPLVARIHGPETRAQWLRHLPMRRYAAPEEITPLVPAAERAASALAERGIGVDLLDLRSLWPWDEEAVCASVGRTGRLLVAQEAVTAAGFGAEVAARAVERLGPGRVRAVRRLGFPRVPVPFAPPLEAALRVTPERIVAAAEEMVRG